MASVTMGPDPTDVVGRRVAAWLVDNLITGAGFFLLVYAFGLNKAPSAVTTTPGITSSTTVAAAASAQANDWFVRILLAQLVWLIFVFIGRSLLVGLLGWSPGKLMLGLRVVNWDGRPPGLVKGFVRELIDTLGQGLLSCLYDLPALFLAMNTHGHRQPADMAAQTYVIDSYYLGRLIVRKSDRVAAGPPSVKREEMEELLRESGVPTRFIPPNAKITEPFYEKGLGTYVVYNVKREAWLKFDKATDTWGPIDDDQGAIGSGATPAIELPERWDSPGPGAAGPAGPAGIGPGS